MGCFTICFGPSKRAKIRKPGAASLFQDQNFCHDREINEALQCIYSTAEVNVTDAISSPLKQNSEEEQNIHERKKVAYHADVMISTTCRRQQKELNPLVESEEAKDTKQDEKTTPPKSEDEANADSSVSSLFTYPPNHRYHNCTTSDDESEVKELEESNLAVEVDSENADVGSKGKDKDDREAHHPLFQEESSESLFSLSIDLRNHISAAEVGEKEVSSPLKPSSSHMNNENPKYIQNVLNPVENRASSLTDEEKENKSLQQEIKFSLVGKENLYIEQEINSPFSKEQPTLRKSKQRSRQILKEEDEIAVDTSLSSWLMVSGKSQTSENSPISFGNSSKRTNSRRNFDDRPVLGVLTLDELKEQSRFLSPLHSPSCSAEDTPTIGTVGSYWKHTGQSMYPNSNTLSRTSGQCN